MNHTTIRKRLSILVALGLVFPVLSLACTAVIPGIAQYETPMPPPPSEIVGAVPATVSYPLVSSDEEMSLVELYARTNPGVVNVTIYGEENDVLFPVGQGSGFVYDENGHVVTNAHVVQEAEDVEVTFSNGTVRTANVIGEDLNSDLAVVQIENLPEGVTPLPLGSMDTLAVGQTVVAIGNPFGLEGTLTRGVISALGRSIPALTPFSIPQSIQTDAAINPGNSGGPLLNLNGEVVGVNDQIRTNGVNTSNLGVGFAIPVSIVRLVVPDLIQKGEHAWAWLGVRGGSLSPSLVEAMDLPVDKGAYLADILPEGPSAQAGLKGEDETVTVNRHMVSIGGDVVTAIDNQPVNSFDDLLIYIALEAEPDQRVTLTILRDGESQDLIVELEERPTDLSTFSLP